MTPGVIGVEESNIPPVAFLDSAVASGRYSSVPLAYVSDRFAVAADHCFGIVGGTVVYYQHFKIVECLA
jgi:hypothetical protein